MKTGRISRKRGVRQETKEALIECDQKACVRVERASGESKAVKGRVVQHVGSHVPNQGSGGLAVVVE